MTLPCRHCSREAWVRAVSEVLESVAGRRAQAETLGVSERSVGYWIATTPELARFGLDVGRPGADVWVGVPPRRVTRSGDRRKGC
jgi:hypothetical protein